MVVESYAYEFAMRGRLCSCRRDLQASPCFALPFRPPYHGSDSTIRQLHKLQASRLNQGTMRTSDADLDYFRLLAGARMFGLGCLRCLSP